MENQRREFIAKNSAVLIVDDIPENLQVLGNILISNGLDVGFATDGKQAIENIRLNKPDLILLDIMMPGIDGFEVCSILKENPETKDIPIIFITARTQTQDIVRAFELGAVDYVSKPFNASELVERVFTQLEIKKSRDLISSQNQQLRELNATKDKFFSIISHDLRGPFTGLLGLTSLIIQENKKMDFDDVIDLVKKLNISINNLYNLLENLLQWANMQTRRFEKNLVKLKLSHLVNDVWTILKNNADKKSIHFTMLIENDIFAFADRVMLRTVLHNLLSNAIKFTPQRGRIVVSAINKSSYIEIKVKDTGVGIEAKDLPKIFNIDSHHTSLGTENEKGTGLGLILCKEMIQLHNGTIWVESQPNSGATFFFTVPKFQENA